MGTKISYRLKRDKLPGGDEIWTGYLSIPTVATHPLTGMPIASRMGSFLPGPPINLKATESSPKRAMGSATQAAFNLLENPVIRDMLPPGASTAISVAKKLASNSTVKSASKSAKKFIKSLW